MNPSYDAFLKAPDEERLGAFLATAEQMGTAVQNIEKDFWVCWTLDVLFNGLPAGHPRLLFKGGTSLSKSFHLISRFSEDIDVTVFRDDLKEPATAQALAAMRGQKRKAKLRAIRDACQAYIQGQLLTDLSAVLDRTLGAMGDVAPGRLEVDADDADGQTLLLWYPTVTAPTDGYIRPAVKIESGGKSALDPNEQVTIAPYVSDALPDLDLSVPNVRTVLAERTFWDKVVILHGLRRWFDARGQLRGGGQRVSRHYYDLYRLLETPQGERAAADGALGEDCVLHARMFFNSPDLDLASAHHGGFQLLPTQEMGAALERDYAAMAGMVFGPTPRFDDVIARIAELELILNG